MSFLKPELICNPPLYTTKASFPESSYSNKLDMSYTEISRLGYYNTGDWKRLRLLKLSEQPLCEHCVKRNKLTTATMVDHVIPITVDNTELFFDYDNLQSLCDKCHRTKTRRDNSRYNPANLQRGKEIKNRFENFD